MENDPASRASPLLCDDSHDPRPRGGQLGFPTTPIHVHWQRLCVCVGIDSIKWRVSIDRWPSKASGAGLDHVCCCLCCALSTATPTLLTLAHNTPNNSHNCTGPSSFPSRKKHKQACWPSGASRARWSGGGRRWRPPRGAAWARSARSSRAPRPRCVAYRWFDRDGMCACDWQAAP